MTTKNKSSKKKTAKKAQKPKTKKLTVKKLKTKKQAKKVKTYVAMVLDQSSSMGTIKTETIGHFNEQLEEIVKNSADMDTKVSLTVFGSQAQVMLFNEPTSSIKPLTNKTYLPSGMTAMYDAIGLTVDKMLTELKDINKKDVAVLFVVLSDGEENNSQKYSLDDVATKIKNLQKTNRWTFTYLGANQDLLQVSKNLNIPVGNTMSFTADPQGMLRATTDAVSSLGDYMQNRSTGTTSTMGYYTTVTPSKDTKSK